MPAHTPAIFISPIPKPIMSKCLSVKIMHLI